MYSYALLETGCYYLIQEKEDSPINLIQVNLETDYCLYVSKFSDEEVMEWKRKTDPIFDILELVGDSTIKEWETLYNKDAYNYEEDDD
jgi:hypothetical protein